MSDGSQREKKEGEVAEGVKGRGCLQVGFEGSCKRFLLQLLDPMASLIDYLYGKHKRITGIQMRLT
ncbi:hypothetical protein K443DRAFT_684123 [Laccaria amethystina LaAM-08-1]|jgi:hypothetical protein|uniref:Uncharacterized protein n=1 Tax=Laccaria amethystina LaAM-08-1 TaxID=1095629 RepID=A0A0C9XCT4_9AGAR|nr:hypothetical protein K443DRAFT_684123 [Laccaria amethystina LaAM-08-1]